LEQVASVKEDYQRRIKAADPADKNRLLKFELKSRLVAADGKWGAMEWVMRGRQPKNFPGLPATNKPFEVRGATVVEFSNGKISRDSDY
jgi:steroid delta-isomerase-like uncharacterized protein